MKKGFTMIELIFVIVILGILASVAIPRLASTRADAEISAAIGNLRTLLSDASQYHVVAGQFGTATYKDFTNVQLKNASGGQLEATTVAVNTQANAWLPVGGVNDCIGIHFVDKAGNAPAYIKFTGKNGASGICQQVLAQGAVQNYTNNTIRYVNNGAAATISNAIAIGSNTEVYNTVVNGQNNQPQQQ